MMKRKQVSLLTALVLASMSSYVTAIDDSNSNVITQFTNNLVLVDTLIDSTEAKYNMGVSTASNALSLKLKEGASHNIFNVHNAEEFGFHYSLIMGNSTGTRGLGKYVVAIGENAAYDSWRNTEYKFAFGENAGIQSGGTYNFTVGKDSGNQIGGNYNVAFGEGAYSFKNATNSYQPYVGNYNFSFGRHANFNAHGNYNFSFGDGAGESIESGAYNFLVGEKSGNLLRGGKNFFFGKESGLSAHGNENVGIGEGAGKSVEGNQNIAVGKNAGQQLRGNRNISIGENANTVLYGLELNDIIAVGNDAKATSTETMALGNSSMASAPSSIAIGYEAKANIANSIALGHGSVTLPSSTETKGLDNTYTSESIAYTMNGNTNTYDLDFAGGDTISGVVSIGKSGQTRRIQHVAPGLIATTSTDAINGSQLYSFGSEVNSKLEKLAAGTWNIYTGGSGNSPSFTVGTKVNSGTIGGLDFSSDFKVVEKTGADNNKYVTIELNRDALKNDPDFKGDQGEPGITGRDGRDGRDGVAGKDGKSAFDIWKESSPENANKTETDFLTATKGEKGEKGAKGDKGDDGVAGAAGKDGKSAFDIWKESNPENADKTESDFLTTIKGEKGETGAKGDKGDAGVAGKDGKSAFDIWKESSPENANKTESDFLNSLKGADGQNGRDGGMDEAVVRELQGQMNHLNRRIHYTGSLNAALSALKPLTFSSDDKFQVMAGMGRYKGVTSTAVGLGYYPNEDILLHAGMAINSEDKMVNAGISLKVGSRHRSDAYQSVLYNEETQKFNVDVTTLTEAEQKSLTRKHFGPISIVPVMKTEIKALVSENANLKDQVQELADQVRTQSEQIQALQQMTMQLINSK